MPIDTIDRPAFRRILYATDFSAHSEATLPYAAALARAHNSQLLIVHVVVPEVLCMEPPVTLSLREAAQRQMEDLQLSDQLEGVQHREIVTEGPIWDGISEIVDKEQVDLIIVGTHGRTGFRKFVMGSVAEEIFRQAPCPVMTIGPAVYAQARRTPQLRTIVYATDFASDCPGALDNAYRLTIRNDARLILLTVASFENAADPEAVLRGLHQKLRALVPQDAKHIETMVEFGQPGQGILTVAHQNDADLIVLGAHRPAMLTNRFMDVAYRVVCEAPCPVLTCNAQVQAQWLSATGAA